MFSRLLKRTAPQRAQWLDSCQKFKFARYYNKAQSQAQEMKDDMSAYEYKPTAINELVPAPRYVDKALNTAHETMRDSKYTRELYRSSVITRKQNEMRYAQGRMYTHLKLEQIKQSVKEVRAKALAESQKHLKKKVEKEVFEKLPVDDQLNLPVGTEFDYVIKQKA